LVCHRALRQIVDREIWLGADLLEKKELCIGDARSALDRARRLAERLHQRADRLERIGHLSASVRILM
jgi:hypothetical protein